MNTVVEMMGDCDWYDMWHWREWEVCRV